MIETVFISDLHLHPQNKDIQARFKQFLDWAKKSSVKKIYILGDFFHVWAGDDTLDEWSASIADQLNELALHGIQLFYMHGNRDFLLGKSFALRAGWSILTEPALIELGAEKVLLAHGDQYCTKDKAHQRFRKLTRNSIFVWIFLKLSLNYRLGLVNKVRQISQENHYKSMEQMDVTPEAVLAHMKRYKVSLLIHGHTHKAGLTSYDVNGIIKKRYVLSDWDDIPLLLCYDNTMGLCFNQNWGCEVNYVEEN